MSLAFALCLIVLFALAAIGMPVAYAILLAAFVYLGVAGEGIGIAGKVLMDGLFSSFILLAVPLFIVAAGIMNAGTISDRLLRFCVGLVGRFKGGLGHVNVVASLIFSGMSGSAVADAAGIGKIIIDMMVKSGHYTRGYAAAITAASATIGPIIPPSIPMVLYALVSDQSVGYLFAAGMAPGLLMALLMGITNTIVARRRNFPVDDSVPLADIPRVTGQAFPALMLPVILLGGIYSGIVTPTEAAAVAAFYALAISVLFYRSVTLGQFYSTLLNSSRSTATVGILIAGALTFNYVITRENVPNSLADFMAQFELSKWGFLIAINILILLLGCILEGGAILLIIIPIFIPTAQALGIDLVHFGVVVVVNAMLGLVTPPYGLLLFIVANITGQPLGRIVRDLLPFLAALFGALAFITFVPDFVLFIPRLLGYTG